jgi:hypothetical protein
LSINCKYKSEKKRQQKNKSNHSSLKKERLDYEMADRSDHEMSAENCLFRFVQNSASTPSTTLFVLVLFFVEKNFFPSIERLIVFFIFS